MITVSIYRPTQYIHDWTVRRYQCPDMQAARKLARRRLGRAADSAYGRSVNRFPYAAIQGDQGKCLVTVIRQPVEIVQSVGDRGVW